MEGRRFNSRPSFGGAREMHKATCSDCGVETEVPFRPIEGRPVYCRDCYQKHKSDRQGRRTDFRRREPMVDTDSNNDADSED